MRLLPFIIILFLSCREHSEQIPASSRMFYFDAVALRGEGQVYIYEPVNNPQHPKEIWHRRFTGDHRDNHLISMLYAPDGTIMQSANESIDQKSATLISLEFSYPSYDTVELLSAKINEATTFLFGTPDSSEAAKYQIEYRDPSVDSVRVILTKERRYSGEEQYFFEGKMYPALRYSVKEMLETETEGFTESEWISTEIYALGIGLVYYKKPVNEGLVMEYRLKEISDYDEFNK